MSGKPRQPKDQLSELRDELVNDVMQTPDEQILAETTAAGGDPAAVAQHVRGLITAAVIRSGKARLNAAREALQASRRGRPAQGQVIDARRARVLLERAAANDPKLRQRLTLAARNGEALSDQDVQSLVEDLQALGALDDLQQDDP